MERYYLDHEHSVIMVPYWMDTAIDSNPPGMEADCIAQEGFKQLHEFSTQINQDAESSFAIHALIYKAQRDGLLTYPQIT